MFTTLAAQNWGMFVLRGILALTLGVLVLAAPAQTLAALIFVFAAYAIVDGVFAILFGAYLIVAPGDGAFAVLFVIGFYALFAGVMYVAIGLRLRGLNKTLQTAPTSAGAAS